MSVIGFNEEYLVQQLGTTPFYSRCLFAASCAERLFPAYLLFFSKTGIGNAEALRAILDKVWATLRERVEYLAVELEHDIEACMTLIPTEESGGEWSQERPWAEDASSAVAYCLGIWNEKGSPQEAAWAARCVYEAVDNYVINLNREQLEFPRDEQLVLSHQVVQTELARQLRDLNDVLAWPSTNMDWPAFTDAFRQRAQEEHALPS